MDAACSICVVLLRLACVVRINCDCRLLDHVDGLVLMDAVVVILVCDRVLRAGALPLTVGLACSYRLLWTLYLVIIWLLSRRSSCVILDVFSTFRTSVGDTLISSGVFLVMFIVTCVSSFPNGCIVCTLGSAWVPPPRCYALVGGAGFADLEMDSLFFTASSMNFRSCCISYAPALLPMFLIALAQSAIAAKMFPAWVMVDFVFFLWLNWAVSVNLSLLVVLMWHICVR